MSYLNRFFKEVFENPNQIDGTLPTTNSLESASDAQLAEHLKIDQYDSFRLTDAVRPAIDPTIKPCQGYRHDTYIDEETQTKVPVVMAAASREELFPLFLKLIQRLGPYVDVVLESSHSNVEGKHVDLYREQIDMAVLTSILWDFEDLLLNDGCTGIAVLNPETPQEIQFEEHKLLIIYGSPLETYEFILEQHGVPENQGVKFITEAEHIHSTSDEYAQRFYELRTALGLDGNQQDTRGQYDQGDQYGSDDYPQGNDSSEGWKDSYGDDSSGGLLS